jgi:hypothetical protein
MSVFYDEASLVVVPSGYKSGKIYAQKPLTTDGQLTFARASTATRVNASGLIETVASGVPRLDYTNSSCPKILLEPQRSNLALQSEALNTTWTDFGTGTTVTANATTAPDGTNTADYVQFPSGSGSDQFVLAQVLTLTTGVPHTISFYAKTQTGTASNLVVRLNGAEAALGQTITTSWQRFTKTLTPLTASDDSGFKNRPAVSGSGTAINVYIWGVQIEAGAYATSYVKTEAAAVTRLADAASKTGISSLIGQTEGTVFVEFNSSDLQSYTQRIFTLSDSTTNNVIGFQLTGANQITFYVENGGANQVAITKSAPAITLGQNVKIAAAYKANDFVLYINGVQVGTDTSGSVPATSALRYSEANDSAPYIGKIAQTLLFKTRLSNAKLAELTSL